MTQQVRLFRVNDDGTAQVFHVRQSACSGDCHKCSGCGAAKETMLLTARNPIGAQPGDLVIIQSETKPVLKAAAILYLVPLVLFFVGYIAGALLWETGALTGGVAFISGMIGAVLYDRCIAAKNNVVYTIMGFADGSASAS